MSLLKIAAVASALLLLVCSVASSSTGSRKFSDAIDDLSNQLGHGTRMAERLLLAARAPSAAPQGLRQQDAAEKAAVLQVLQARQAQQRRVPPPSAQQVQQRAAAAAVHEVPVPAPMPSTLP